MIKIAVDYQGEFIEFSVYEQGNKFIAECDFGDPYTAYSFGDLINEITNDGGIVL